MGCTGVYLKLPEMAQATTAPLQPPWSEPNGISASYDLHCHCGAVRYSITLSPPLYQEQAEGRERWTAIECNCSHCERVGAINVHPLTNDVEFTQGRENMAEYRSGGKKNPHFICKLCGCFLVTDLSAIMKEMGLESRMAVNVRLGRSIKIAERAYLLTRV